MTSTEVQPWEEPAAPVVHLAAAPSGPAPATTDIDSWVAIASAYTKLANQIANTDFPPAEMRGKPEALVATFLMGREMNLGPMTALMNLHVIKGKVGQSAHLMRAMILAKGHEIEYDETTDTQCTCRGRRRGEQSWTYVTFTAQQARTAKIDLGGYPADKLVARATARLARRKFADVIAGMEYSNEELEAGDYVFGDDATQTTATDAAQAAGEEAPTATRTAKRPTSTRKAPTASRRAAPRERTEQPATAGPPLPGEEESASDQPAPAPAAGQRNEKAKESADNQPAAPEAKMATKNQLGKLSALFREAKVEDRAQRLQVVASMADRDIASSTELTQDEASTLIDNLVDLGADGIAAMAGAPPSTGEGEQQQLGDDQADDAEVVEDGADS